MKTQVIPRRHYAWVRRRFNILYRWGAQEMAKPVTARRAWNVIWSYLGQVRWAATGIYMEGIWPELVGPGLTRRGLVLRSLVDGSRNTSALLWEALRDPDAPPVWYRIFLLVVAFWEAVFGCCIQVMLTFWPDLKFELEDCPALSTAEADDKDEDDDDRSEAWKTTV